MLILLDGALDGARHWMVAQRESAHPSRLNAVKDMLLSPFLARPRKRVHAQSRRGLPGSQEEQSANGNYRIGMGG